MIPFPFQDGQLGRGDESLNLLSSMIWTSSGGANVTITEDGRLFSSVSGAAALWHKASGNIAKGAGSWYAEVEAVAGASGNMAIGVAASGISTASAQGGSDNAGDGGRYQYFATGQKRSNGLYESYGAAYTNGDVVGIGIAHTGSSVTVTAYKNGVSQGTMFTFSSSSNIVIHACFYGPNLAARFRSTPLYLPSGFTWWA